MKSLNPGWWAAAFGCLLPVEGGWPTLSRLCGLSRSAAPHPDFALAQRNGIAMTECQVVAEQPVIGREAVAGQLVKHEPEKRRGERPSPAEGRQQLGPLAAEESDRPAAHARAGTDPAIAEY